VLVEPPRQDVPPRHGVTPLGLRAAALTAALVLAVLSRGDVIALAVLLAVGTWRPLPTVAIVSALGATAWRWSSTGLDDITGAQAVLGPAGVVDPPLAAVAAWVSALAIVLATPNLVEAHRREIADGDVGLVVLAWLPWVTSGATAALIVAGPALGGDVWARLLATAVGVALAAWVGGGRSPFSRAVLERAAAGLGLASLVAVAIDAPTLGEVLDVDALVEGVALGLAAGALAWAVGAVVTHHQRARAVA